MLIVAALLMASQPAPAAEREVLDAFKAACARTGDVEAMKGDAAASGWSAVADDADPRLGKLNKLGRDAVAGEGKLSGGSYRRTLAGRELFLIVSRFEDRNGYWGVGCRLYDFAATAPLDPAGLEAWMGRPSTGSTGAAPGIHRLLWEPGWREGVTIEVTHVPSDHEISKTLGLQGNVLVAQAIGGF